MSAVAPDKLAKGAWWALVLVAATNAVSLLDRQILAILAPSIKADLKIGDAEMGLLFGTVFALFYALFSLPLGRLADGWVRTRLLSLSIAFWSLATALGGLAGGFSMLALSRLGVGIGEASAAPAGTSLIYDFWPRHRRGFVMAVLASAIALGIGGSLVLGGFAANWWTTTHPQSALRGWQFAFFAAALPGVILAVAMRTLKEPKRGAMDGIATAPDPAPFAASWKVLSSVIPGFNWLALRRAGANAGMWRVNLAWLVVIVAVAAALTQFTSAISPRPPLDFGAFRLNPHLLQWLVTGFGAYVIVNLMQSLALDDPEASRVISRSPTLIMAMCVGMLQSVINYGMMAFNPSFLMRYYHLSMKDTALQFGLVSAGMGILGPLFWGPLSDWLHRRNPGAGRALTSMFCMAVSPLMSFWVYFAPESSGFFWRFVAYSLVLTGWMPPLYAIIYDQVLPRMRGMTGSLYLMLATIGGMGIGPYVVGLISDATGDLRTAMLSINIVAVPIAVLILAISRRAHRDEAALLDRARA